MTMINSLCDSMAEIYLAQGGRKVGYNMRVFLYNHLQKLSLSFHGQSRTGDILTRVTSDVAAVEDFIISNLSDFLGSTLNPLCLSDDDVLDEFCCLEEYWWIEQWRTCCVLTSVDCCINYPD